jgi:hypothetical protein
MTQESDVAAIGFTSNVESSLQKLKSLSDQLTNALEAKVTSGDATTIEQTSTVIDTAFSSAIAAYGS